MANTNDDAITIYLRGGLGNQIFTFAAGLEQARRLNCELVVDCSHYRPFSKLLRPSETRRKMELLDFGAMENVKYVRRSKPLELIHDIRHSVKTRRPIFIEKSQVFDPSINDIEPGTTLYGYFQNPQYFKNIGSEIHKWLKAKNPAKTSNLNVISNSTGIHVRRGDYLRAKAKDHHGLLGFDYFRSAAEQVKSTSYSSTNFLLFTDSPGIVWKEFSELENVSLYSGDRNHSSATLLHAMSSCQAFVMSNSTLSWWAAWLISRENSDAVVVYPDPWQPGSICPELHMPNWIRCESNLNSL